jgi:hypothetical protein
MRTDKLSYEEVAEWFTRARNPDAGRPVMSWARMYKVGDTYELRFDTAVVGVFTPDNKFTFKLTSQEARRCSITLSQALQRAIPFLWTRVATGRYTVTCTTGFREYCEDNPDGYRWDYFKTAPAYDVFDGLQFDLNTYEPTNAKPPLNSTDVIKENKLMWLRSLRKFKMAIKVRARMGVLESLIKKVEAERVGINRHQWEMPDWGSDTWQEVLYTSIRDSECSMELLKGFIKSVSTGYYSSAVSVEEVIEEVDKVCTTYSIDLRRRFGVFNEVPTVQDKNEVPRHTMERSHSTDSQAMVM